MAALSYADVVAGVGAAIGAYAHAMDDGRVDDILATFCPDGRIDLGPMGAHAGLDDLRVAYTGWIPRRPQRHLVSNTHVREWSDDEATAVSDLVFLLKGDEGWVVQMVGRYEDVLHRDGDRWRFHSRTATFS